MTHTHTTFLGTVTKTFIFTAQNDLMQDVFEKMTDKINVNKMTLGKMSVDK